MHAIPWQHLSVGARPQKTRVRIDLIAEALEQHCVANGGCLMPIDGVVRASTGAIVKQSDDVRLADTVHVLRLARIVSFIGAILPRVDVQHVAMAVQSAEREEN